MKLVMKSNRIIGLYALPDTGLLSMSPILESYSLQYPIHQKERIFEIHHRNDGYIVLFH